MRTSLREELKNDLLVVVGLLVAAAAYRMYLIPNQVVNGGFTGVGQLLNHATGISIGLVNIALNVPLFLISMKSMGLRFGVRSLVTMVLLSLLIDHIPLPPATGDMLLASVYGGAISGIGFGLVLRGSATTGGTDMLASLLHRLIPVLRVSYGIFLDLQRHALQIDAGILCCKCSWCECEREHERQQRHRDARPY